MTISQKQLIANRANAQKSTGPRTVPGKQISSRNAVKHGLYSRDTVINSPHLKESQIEYDELLQGLTNELKPEGAFQRQLVHTIANCLWRQRRAINAETAHLNRELKTQSELFTPIFLEESFNDESDDIDLPDESMLNKLENLAASNSIPTGNFCLALLRYEMRLDVRLARAYKLLRHLQLKINQSEENTPFKKNIH